MHLKEMARTLSLRKSSSSRWAESSILAENLTSQSMRFTKYEDLSKSMRMEGFIMDDHQPEICYGHIKEGPRSESSRCGKLRSISLGGRKATAKFSFDAFPQKQMKVADEMKGGKVKVKKRSSWWPDPSRRWPIQGW